MRNSLCVFVALMLASFCPNLEAQQISPKEITVRGLANNPRAFDGLLIRVTGLIPFGWEGDNFLLDLPNPASANLKGQYERGPMLWFHGNEGEIKKASEAYQKVWARGTGYASGTFTGYFHFVPSKKGRIKDVFDPGPFQLEVTTVADISIHQNQK